MSRIFRCPPQKEPSLSARSACRQHQHSRLPRLRSRMKLPLLALLVLVLALSGCSSGAGSSDAQGRTVIRWWDTMTSEATQGALRQIIADYESAHPDVKIERTYVSFADMKNKLLLGSAGSTMPDIVWMDSPDHQSFAAAGILADITDEVQAWGEADEYFEGPWSSTVYEGRNYGVPIGSNNLALYYNKDMLNEAGIEPPKTWDELYAAAEKLSKPGVYGFAMTAVKTEEGTFQFLPLLYQSGSDLTNFDNPDTVRALTLIDELVANGYMSKEIMNQKQSDTVIQFSTGKVAMMMNGTWQIPLLRKEAKVNWDVVQLPADKQSATVLGGENWAITDASKHKDIAFDIIKFASEPEQSKKFLQAAGRLPSREDYLQDPFWQDDPQLKIFADNMSVARARAYGPNYPKMSEAIQLMTQEVIIDMKTPEEAVKDAAAKIEQEL
ncbi:ABC transporter substrate-binding protein [Saccharibacillus alkalitolerans]|uniref:Sugar ABC transporter substrate-binding protein n=1 Tax=Saccharibacillus alkalitolerans TaxID=2705290 RepID=A0ABX0F3D0_9BACL|nr:sugar ABC transporter substrate-binding protein [Saccharibacillus alkalitolerans]NGZ74935.1 sugar ABC transporter substrate-binding protein [Saccharibacillus alkalitolerans]